jgi:hypothetical protein
MHMKIVMDSDCLIKLTKAGAKEFVLLAMEVHIPQLVKKETVDEVKERGYQDALIIEKNIESNTLHVVKHRGRSLTTIPSTKGEMEVISLYLEGSYNAIASDDSRFLKKLETANIPYLTPSACVVYLYTCGRVGKSEVLHILEDMKPFISKEEYMISKFYLEGRI